MNLGLKLRGLAGAIDPDQMGINGRMGGPDDRGGIPQMGGAPQQDNGFLGIRPGSRGAIIAGIIGDSLASISGGAPVFTQNLMAQRQADASEAQWNRRQAETRTANREDQRWEWENRPREAPTPGSFGWYQGASDAERARYDEYNPVTVATGQGPVRVPRNRPAAGATVSREALGLPPLQAPAPTMQNTPSPQLNAQGVPPVLSQAQYMAVVAARGQAETDAWMARNGVRVGN